MHNSELLDERKLISELKHDSEDAFRLIYDRYWHSVFHFASLYLNRRNDVEEVVQEVFIRLWESRLTLRDNTNLKSFLFIVTRNLVFTGFRRSFNRSFYSLTVINALSDGSDTGQQAELNDLMEQLEKLTAGMPEQRRRVFEMSRVQYLSYREIAAKLAISEKTVERHINEALKYLKAHLRLELFTLFLLSYNFF